MKLIRSARNDGAIQFFFQETDKISNQTNRMKTPVRIAKNQVEDKAEEKREKMIKKKQT